MTTRHHELSLCALGLALLAMAGCSAEPSDLLAPEPALATAQVETIAHAKGEVGPAGGTVTVSGAMVVVPKGALQTKTTVRLTQFSDGTVELEPHGQTFFVPVELHLSAPTGASPASCAVQWLDLTQNSWVTIPSVAGGMGRVAPLQHFSRYRIDLVE